MTLSFAPECIETWPLERLKPYARNAKMHGADQVAKIAGSMAQFGWTVPVLVSGDGEVIAGQLAGPRRGADRGRARARPRRHAEGSGSHVRAHLDELSEVRLDLGMTASSPSTARRLCCGPGAAG
jgi:hypothetical protein